MRSKGTALSLCVHWNRATAFADSAIHTIDLGPSGMSGIRRSTARNLDGRGACVIVIGEQGKGSSELYTLSGVKYESLSRKKFPCKLGKFPLILLLLDIYYIVAMAKWHRYAILKASRQATNRTCWYNSNNLKAGVISASLSSDFYIEFVGGGNDSIHALQKKAAEFNPLYINPRQFGLRPPPWRELCGKYVPVEGFYVAADIPIAEHAAEIVAGLKAAGIHTSLSSLDL
jgi:fatty acid synthase subunit alpha, fungi type